MKYAIVLLITLTLSACGGDVKEVPPTSGPQQSAPAQATVPTPAPPSPTPVPPKVIGQPVVLEDSRTKTLYSITLNGFRDPAVSSNQFNNPVGRWVLADWTIRNEGTGNISFSSLSLKLLTVEDFEIERGNHAGHATPQLESFPTLGPGQSLRGFMAYDVPRGAILKAAIFHPSGSPQFIIANLP